MFIVLNLKLKGISCKRDLTNILYDKIFSKLFHLLIKISKYVLINIFSSYRYHLMLKCWDKEPLYRPAFSEISNMLGNMLNKNMKQVIYRFFILINTWHLYTQYTITFNNTELSKQHFLLINKLLFKEKSLVINKCNVKYC